MYNYNTRDFKNKGNILPTSEMDFISRLDAESDDFVMSVVKREYSYMLQIGGLFLNLRPRWRYLSLLQFTIYFVLLIYFIILLTITAVTWKNDLSNTSQSAHFAALAATSVIVISVFPYHRSRVIDLMRIVGNNYYQYKDGFKSEFETKWKKDIRKMKIGLLIIVPLYFLIVASVTLFIAPMIDEYQGYTPNEIYIDSIYTETPIPLIFPYEINTPMLHYFSVFCEVIVVGTVAFSEAGADLMLIFFSQEVALQMKILRESVQKIENRALNIFQKLYNDGKKKKRKDLYTDERYMDILDWCLKQNVEHHILISRVFEHIYVLGKWPLGIAFLLSSVVIAFSLFVIVTADKTRIASQLLSLMLLFGEIWNMIIICWIGQQLTDTSAGITEDLYNVKWMYWNKKCVRSLMIFKERLKKPLTLLAAGMIPINIGMFGTIMNSAYSYFNLIFAYKDTSNAGK